MSIAAANNRLGFQGNSFSRMPTYDDRVDAQMPLGDAPTGKESVTCKDVFLPQEPMKRRTKTRAQRLVCATLSLKKPDRKLYGAGSLRKPVNIAIGS